MANEQSGLIATLAEPTTFESSIIRVRLDEKKVRPSYANRYLSSGIGNIARRRFIRQVAVSGVSSEDVAQFSLPIPPTAEQEAIVSYLEANDSLLEEEKRQVEKLMVLKQGLMDDLLTGRVRVPLDTKATA